MKKVKIKNPFFGDCHRLEIVIRFAIPRGDENFNQFRGEYTTKIHIISSEYEHLAYFKDQKNTNKGVRITFWTEEPQEGNFLQYGLRQSAA